MSKRLPNYRVFRRLLAEVQPTVKQQQGLLAGGFAALLAETLLRLLEPWPLKYVVDQWLMPLASGELNPNAIQAGWVWAVALALAGVVGLRALAAYGWTLGFAIAGNRVLLAVRAKTFRHLQGLSLSFHARARKGDLLSRVVEDVAMVRDVVVTALLPLVGNVLLLIVMLGVMTWLNARLTLCVLLAAPLLALLANRRSQSIRHAAREQRQRVGQVAATVGETLASIKAVQALDLNDRVSAEFGAANNADLRSGVKVKRLTAGMERSVDLVLGVVTGLVLAVGVFEVMAARLTAGELLVFLAYVRSVAKPVRNWAKFTARINKSHAGAERILSVLNEKPAVSEASDARELAVPQGHLELRDVSFDYEPGKPVLKDVNLMINPGETVALIGPSGAGKSTLLALLLRLHDPDSGVVLLDGQPLSGLTLASVRRAFAVALQDPLLFHGTVAENIAMGSDLTDPRTNRRVQLAAEKAIVTEFTDRWPLGLDTPIGESGATLSNGQKQRISLARALLSDAPIVLLDEPLTALDEVTSRAVDAFLRHHTGDRTCVVVTHELRQSLWADRVYAVSEGSVRRVSTTELKAGNPKESNLQAEHSS